MTERCGSCGKDVTEEGSVNVDERTEDYWGDDTRLCLPCYEECRPGPGRHDVRPTA